ncbi:MAG: hypothetical protein ACP5NV_04085 [Candidatus Woesearchaeota archaeon]
MGFKKLFRSQEFWVAAIFVVVLAVRLIIAFQSQFFNYEAYFDLRQVQSIKDTGLPLYNDNLSYGGKSQLFAPMHYYILTFFGLFISPEVAAKILPNVLASLIVIVSFFIALKITKSPKISLLTSFMTGFIPIFFFDINRISIDYLSVLLMLGIIYCIFRINEKKYVDYSLILIFILVLTTPLALVLIVGLLFYLLLMKLEDNHIEMKELEIILFFAFLTVWVNLLIYKNAFLNHGFMVIWQNTPTQLLNNFFGKLTLLESLYTISIIPLLLGLYGFYLAFHEEKNKEVMLLTGFGIAIFLLMWFRLMNIVTSLMLLSLMLVLISSFALKRVSLFVEKTKIHKYEQIFLGIFMVLFVATSVLPSIYIGLEKSKDTPNIGDVVVLEWASQGTSKTSTISSTLQEGHLVAYYSQRKNIMDENYLLTPNIDQRYKDLEKIYTTQFQIEAVTNLNKYDSKYIFFTDNARREYDIHNLSYLQGECFEKIFYSQNASMYMNKCKVVEDE